MPDILAPLLAALQARRQGRPLLLLLDYDGTLVEIAPRPELARPTPALLALLSRLTARRDQQVVVVSGRPLTDLMELLPVSGLHFLGSHGGELFLHGHLQSRAAAAVDGSRLKRWRQRLAALLAPFPGWRLEDKPGGFALHYRQLPPEHLPAFREALAGWRDEAARALGMQLLPGKKVLEILPRGVSKGTAIRKLMALSGFSGHFPVYCGDDVTDESAFLALRQQGLTIKVGRSGPATAATHFLPDPESVRQFLALLANS